MDEVLRVLPVLESHFCVADVDLLRLLAERTLPDVSADAATEESADAAR